MNTITTVGIIGGGKLGTTLARLAAEAGYNVLIHTREKPMLEMIMETIVPEAQLVDFPTLISRSDIVILAVPHTALGSLELSKISGVIIDATNPWEATDTHQPNSLPDSTQEIPLVKSLNHISYEELSADARINQPGPRRAVAMSSSSPKALAVAEEFISSVGFDPVEVSPEESALFNPDGRLFGAWLSKEDVAKQLALQ